MSSSLINIQNSLSAGELSPSLRGRTDIKKYGEGTTTCRNFFANYRGGVSSRAGLAYVGTCKQQYPVPPRDIPFQFSISQGYALEFGDQYLRVKSGGGYVLEASKFVTGVDNTGLFTVASHGYSVGDWVFDTNNTGFTGLTWIVHTVPTGNTFTVTDLFGNVVSSATPSGSGQVARIYTQVSPYAAIDLPYLKYTQSADVMTLTCVNTSTDVEYPPYSLVRNSNTNWAFTPDTFTSSVLAPTGLAATAHSSTTVSTWYSYVVTAVNASGEESNPSTPVNVQNVDIALNLGSNALTWNESAGAKSYNVYASTPSYSTIVPVSSLFGFVGTALGTSFTDTNITPDFTTVPPQHTDPFARGTITEVTINNVGSGNYSQQTVGYNVTTSTGSGFAGTPVVTLGTVSGFVITNPGKNYQPGDTIHFTDSGGGLAIGGATFTANPADGDTAKFNGIVVKFTVTPNYPSDVGQSFIYSRVENTKELTAQTLANTLNASSVLSLSVAQYTASGAALTIQYKTPGAIGNAYTTAAITAPMTFSGANLTGGGTAGTGATGQLVISQESGTYPSVAAYYSQRRVYASSLNNPDTYWMSQPGRYSNMDSSIPVTAADAITGTPWAQQVNGIEWLVPMPGGLVVLTGKGAWQVNGGANAAITPSTQTATPQAYNGCNNFVAPQIINYDILYVQSLGNAVRDLSYNFFTNIYTGTDLTILSSHLFTGRQLLQSAYCEEPYKLVWYLRDDGILLCLTYLKEQEVYSWTRHDTNGQFVSVCSVSEPPVDALYVITERYIEGAWRYYSERMDNRIWNNVENAFCVDAGLTSPVFYPQTTCQASGITGTVSFKSVGPAFDINSIGRIIRIAGGKALITGFTDSFNVTGTVTETLTDTIPNDPNLMPVPAEINTWSVAPLITTVSGLNHLEGMTVAILADGSVVKNQVVTNGSVTLPQPASLITIGLPYTCQVQTVYIDAPSNKGTVQNRRKTINAVGLRVEATRGLKLGSDQPDAEDQQNYTNIPWTDINEVKERTPMTQAGVAVPLFTGDYYKTVTSGWAIQGQVAVQQDYPLPANILSVISYWTLGDD